VSGVVIWPGRLLILARAAAATGSFGNRQDLRFLYNFVLVIVVVVLIVVVAAATVFASHVSLLCQ